MLRGLALSAQEQLRVAVDAVAADAPFRHMLTPGGLRMSVAMTNCGAYGWVSSTRGYRYSPTDPETVAIRLEPTPR